MYFISFSYIWIIFFFILFYLTILLSVLVYLIPIFINFFNTIKIKKKFYFINALSLFWIFFFYVLVLTLTLYTLQTPITSIWSNHFLITNYSIKIFYFISIFFLLMILIYTTSFYLSSKEIYDYFMVLINFNLWIIMLHFTNSLFSVMFIIEVLTTLILLLNTTSVFSTTYFNLNYKFSYYTFNHKNLPSSFIKSILFYFWTSLIASLMLFFFLLFFYQKINTFDWYLIEYIFTYFINFNSTQVIFKFSLVWYLLIFTFFLKCGLMPYFIWKPTYFKGVSYYTLFWYITYFYFFLFIFITQLFINYLSIIFYQYIYLITIFVLIGLVLLNLIMLETYYIKSFLAISSILNSTYLIFILINPQIINLLFWL
uniref:NADH dehydrogenase subunit 2a n=1 Tax=Strombidium sp. TaxID=181122 RepID=A0A7T0M4L1_9SPIT|nr:NADH dehydrogenase subunit 2a [Strombidium sp.]